MKKLTREWVRKAEADWTAAERLAGSKPPLHDAVCFHAQQSAEKYCKAVLQEFAITIPRTHDLERLLTLVLPDTPELAVLRRRMAILSQFAVEYRYPGMMATGKVFAQTCNRRPNRDPADVGAESSKIEIA